MGKARILTIIGETWTVKLHLVMHIVAVVVVVVVGVCRYFVVVFHRRFSNRRFLSCRIV
jgi:hypothetical protein